MKLKSLWETYIALESRKENSSSTVVCIETQNLTNENRQLKLNSAIYALSKNYSQCSLGQSFQYNW